MQCERVAHIACDDSLAGTKNDLVITPFLDLKLERPSENAKKRVKDTSRLHGRILVAGRHYETREQHSGA